MIELDIKTSTDRPGGYDPSDEYLISAPHLSRPLLQLAQVLIEMLDGGEFPIFNEGYPPESAIPEWQFSDADKRVWKAQVAIRDLHESPSILVYLYELESRSAQVKNGGIQINVSFTCLSQTVHVSTGSGTRKGAESDVELVTAALVNGSQIRRGREAERSGTNRIRSVLEFI